MMETLRAEHLTNAPIREALIDIQVMPDSSFNPSRLDDIEKEINSKYPIREDLKHNELGLNIEIDGISAPDFKSIFGGSRFKSIDQKQIVQFRRNGFTFSQLEPYKDWLQMQQEAKMHWETYKRHFSSKGITRIATRFINVFKFNLPANLNEYFHAYPNVPSSLDGLALNIDNYLYRMTLANEDIESFAIVTQAFQGLNSTKNTAEIILDIDAITQKNRDFNDNSLWDCFESLHKFKNDIFFGYITEKTRALYR